MTFLSLRFLIWNFFKTIVRIIRKKDSVSINDMLLLSEVIEMVVKGYGLTVHLNCERIIKEAFFYIS